MQIETVVTIRENDISISGEGFEPDKYPTLKEWESKIQWTQDRLKKILGDQTREMRSHSNLFTN
jgi:hypothetical protein